MSFSHGYSETRLRVWLTTCAYLSKTVMTVLCRAASLIIWQGLWLDLNDIAARGQLSLLHDAISTTMSCMLLNIARWNGLSCRADKR